MYQRTQRNFHIEKMTKLPNGCTKKERNEWMAEWMNEQMNKYFLPNMRKDAIKFTFV